MPNLLPPRVMIVCLLLNFITALLHRHNNALLPSSKIIKYLDDTNLFKFCSSLSMKKEKSNIGLPIAPEFSRIINVAQIPARKPVLCRLLAKEEERAGLAKRFDIHKLEYFAANVTISYQDEVSIQVAGRFEARIKVGEIAPDEIVDAEFETLILNNAASFPDENESMATDRDPERLKLADAVDYDDEVAPDGSIDVGEIAAQYLALELF